MDLVTEKFKQKIAAVFYLNGGKFNQTRILQSEERQLQLPVDEGDSHWVSEPEENDPALSYSLII